MRRQHAVCRCRECGGSGLCEHGRGWVAHEEAATALEYRIHTPEFEQPPRPADRTAADRRKRALESTAAETMTRPLFVAAVRQHVGKTTVSLALMNGLRKRFGKVGRPR